MRRTDDFEAVLLSELETLRKSETRLSRLYSQLPAKPQLREIFLSELAEVKQRTERLFAVLNPCEALKPAETLSFAADWRPAA